MYQSHQSSLIIEIDTTYIIVIDKKIILTRYH